MSRPKGRVSAATGTNALTVAGGLILAALIVMGAPQRSAAEVTRPIGEGATAPSSSVIAEEAAGPTPDGNAKPDDDTVSEGDPASPGGPVTTDPDVAPDDGTGDVTEGVTLTATLTTPTDHRLSASKAARASWNVDCPGLDPVRSFRLTLTLLDGPGGSPIAIGGAPVEASVESAETDGFPLPLALSFDSSALGGAHLSARVVLSDEDREVARWESGADELIVVAPTLTSQLTDGVDGDETLIADPAMELVESVHYEELVPDGDYRAIGLVMDPATTLPLVVGAGPAPTDEELSTFLVAMMDAYGLRQYATCADEAADASDGLDAETADDAPDSPDDADVADSPSGGFVAPTTIDAEAVKALEADCERLGDAIALAEAPFTPDGPSGDVELTYAFDGSRYGPGQQDRPVETLTLLVNDDSVVAAEIELDGSRTATIVAPEVAGSVQLASSGGHTIAAANAPIELIDNVHFDNVVSDKPYELKTTLVDRDTGEDVVIDGEPLSATTSFTPEDAEGDVAAALEVNPASMAGQTLVAREELYRDGTLVAAHEADSDGDQGIAVVNDLKGEGSTYAKTGFVLPWCVAVLAAGGAVSVGVGWRLRRKGGC